MYRKRLFLGFLLTFFISMNIGKAQDTGIVKFFVEVDNGYFEILINDTIYLKRYKDTLPVGNYSAQIWSPGYVQTVAEFQIEKGKTTEVFVEMAKSNKRIQFEADYRDYRMNFHKSLTLPVSLTLFTSVVTAYYVMKSYDLKNDIFFEVELYEQSSSTSEIIDIKLGIDELNKRYNRNRYGYFISGGISSLLLIGTIYSYSRFKKNYTEPQLNSKSPFKDRFSFYPTIYGGGVIFKI